MSLMLTSGVFRPIGQVSAATGANSTPTGWLLFSADNTARLSKQIRIERPSHFGGKHCCLENGINHRLEYNNNNNRWYNNPVF